MIDKVLELSNKSTFSVNRLTLIFIIFPFILKLTNYWFGTAVVTDYPSPTVLVILNKKIRTATPQLCVDRT